MSWATTVEEELLGGSGVRVLRPATLSFFKAFTQVTLVQFLGYGMFVIVILINVGSLPHDWYEKLSLTALSIPLVALVVSPWLLLVRRIDRMWHWEYDHLGLRISFRNVLRADIKWSQISSMRYRKKRVSLRLERWWLVFGMSSIPKTEYQALRAVWEEYRDESGA